MFLLLDKRRVESFCPGRTGLKALLERSQAIHVPAHQWRGITTRVPEQRSVVAARSRVTIFTVSA